MFDMDLVRAIALHGTLQYPHCDAKLRHRDGILECHCHFSTQEAPQGTYLLLVTPYAVDGMQSDEALTRRRITTAAGLLAAFNGRNVVYSRLFDAISELSGPITSFGPTVENPGWFARPDLSDSRIDTISGAARRVAILSKSEDDRICRSLQWFESGLYDSGVGGYIKYWIAIETLVKLPNRKLVGRINELLACAYSRSLEAVEERFEVGRLYGLRCNIVHHGQLYPIHGSLLQYLEALYTDVLFTYLDLPCESRAANAMEAPGFVLSEHLASVLAKRRQ